MSYYTATFKTNLLGTLYMNKQFKVTSDPNERVAISDELFNAIKIDNVIFFLARDFNVDKDKLVVEIIKEDADMNVFTKELQKGDRKYYSIPNPEKDKIEEIEKLQDSIKELQHQIRSYENQLEEIEYDKDEAEDELKELLKKYEEVTS